MQQLRAFYQDFDSVTGDETLTPIEAYLFSRSTIQVVPTELGAAVQTFLAAAVNTTDDTISIPDNGFQLGQKVALTDETSALATGLSAATDYYLIISDADTIKFATTLANALAGTAVDITAAGSGHAHTINFTDAVAASTFTVDNTTDLITKANDTLWTGAKVQVSNSGGALPSPLVAATDYYWIRSSATTGKLAATRADASAGTPIDILDDGTGTNTITPQATPATRTYSSASVNTTNNTVDTDAAHGAVAGDLVQLTAQATGLPGGLSATDYYVVPVDDDLFKLATSRANAIAGTVVDITTAGSVSIHTLTPAALAGGAVTVQVSNDPNCLRSNMTVAEAAAVVWSDLEGGDEIADGEAQLITLVDLSALAIRLKATATAGAFSARCNITLQS